MTLTIVIKGLLLALMLSSLAKLVWDAAHESD